MSHLILTRTRGIVACFAFSLFFIQSLRAQEPWPPSPLVPPDTTTYQVSTEYGAIATERRPPDSLIIPGELIIRFAHGALDSGILSHTYWEYFYGHTARKRGGRQPLSGGGPYDGLNQPRGFFPALRSMLFADQFRFDSADNIVKDAALKSFFIGNHCHYLHRLTTASPIDTLSVTRDGDTIGCDHADWMILQMDSNVNPLLLTGLLMAGFPRDIIEAYPSYRGAILLSQVPGNANWECQVSDTMINAPLAWDHEVGDTNIIVAHFDEGFAYKHPGFLDTSEGKGHKILFRWDYRFDTPQTDTSGVTDHGTGCIGMIGLETNRGDSIPGGVAGGWGPLAGGTDTIDRGRGVSIAALTAAIISDDEYVRAIFEASAHSPTTPYGLGVHVFNTSLDLDPHTFGETDAVNGANYAYENGVVQTAARTEYGGHVSMGGAPAGFDPSWMISVGASVTDKSKAGACDYGETMDLLAPSGDNEYGSCGPPNARGRHAPPCRTSR